MTIWLIQSPLQPFASPAAQRSEVDDGAEAQDDATPHEPAGAENRAMRLVPVAALAHAGDSGVRLTAQTRRFVRQRQGQHPRAENENTGEDEGRSAHDDPIARLATLSPW